MPRLTLFRTACRGLLAVLGLASLAACSTTDGRDRLLGLITPYRADLVQGNVVTREQAASLRPGMSRDQVRQQLGAPLLTDVFHGNRWDYVFLMRRQGTEAQLRSLVVLFDGDVVSRVEAPDLPSEYEFVQAISKKPVSEATPKLALSPEERAALPLPTPRESALTAAPQGAARPYPPLETSQ